MTARAQSVARTRGHIVAAAMELHAEQGVVRTSWDDIATAAGVSTATVYRHFPSLAELVPACAHTVFDVIRPPTIEEAAPQFAQLDRAADRLEQLVRASCHCYSEGEGWLHAAQRERDFVPELDDALGVIDGTLAVLVRAAAGRQLPKADHRILVVLCDFPLWKSLVDTGLTRPRAEDAVVALVRAHAAQIALD